MVNIISLYEWRHCNDDLLRWWRHNEDDVMGGGRYNILEMPIRMTSPCWWSQYHDDLEMKKTSQDDLVLVAFKALGKLGNIVAETLWFVMFPQMFPCLPPMETLLRKQNLLPEKQKCFLENSETFYISLCFSLMFPSVCPLWETWRKIGRKQCFNVS
jgi:predicted metal-binding membrane protein